jgi:hypothetical protein
MTRKEFIEEIFELAGYIGENDEISLTFLFGGYDEVLAKMKYYTELSYKAEEFIQDAEGL